MKLLLDVGNTAIKWALFGGTGLQDGGRILRSQHAIVDMLTKLWVTSDAPEAIIVASVAGQAFAIEFVAACQQLWGMPPYFIKASAVAHGVTCAYAVPENLGADRWAALIGARAEGVGNICVISAGTAITVDMLNAQGQHLGGLIAPGLGLMRQSLLRDTGKIAASGGGERIVLPDQSQNPNDWLGLDTASAVGYGVFEAAAGLMMRVEKHLNRQPSLSASVWLTGGHADLLAPAFSAKVNIIPDLVLRGLATIARDIEGSI